MNPNKSRTPLYVLVLATVVLHAGLFVFLFVPYMHFSFMFAIAPPLKNSRILAVEASAALAALDSSPLVIDGLADAVDARQHSSFVIR